MAVGIRCELQAPRRHSRAMLRCRWAWLSLCLVGLTVFSLCLLPVARSAESKSPGNSAAAPAAPVPPPVPLPESTSAATAPETAATATSSPTPSTQTAEQTIEQLTATARKSVVVVEFSGRDGKRQGLGSGFIIHPDGLIATNLHVIGEARPISVQLADGKTHDVVAIEAFDRTLDLAVIRIDAKGLPTLPLGDSDQLKQGQAVVAIGNPLGLKHSVVSGIVSGTREIDGRPMIQLAIPIEPGNSGGPLLDMQGRVHGILTIKSLVTDNLGFAVAINSLKPLIEKPNPTLMSRWLTIGALDPKEWTPLFGARWRQHAGRMKVDGQGQGFGGRSLLIAEQAVPEFPYEVAVAVKLGDEGGAAGLIFGSDGRDRNFGFYPSNGKLRLSRFDGPDVFAWNVLKDQASEHYRPGEWNTLKVRLEQGKIQCFVNEHPVFEATDSRLTGGKVGLAKFRDTHAEFKSFQVAREIPSSAIAADVVNQVTTLASTVPPTGPLSDSLTEKLLPQGEAGVSVLRDEAQRLEQQAAQLRKLALNVHHRHIQEELTRALAVPEDKIDLLHAALLIARMDNEEVDPAAYVGLVDRMAREIRESLPESADESARLAALNNYLFAEHGFHGSRGEYYHKSNSYVNEVLDDREGLPITLSVVYMELARRLDLTVVGVALPGHFVTQFLPTDGDPLLIDVFNQAKVLSRADAYQLVLENTGKPLTEDQLSSATRQSILVRMLHNLMGLSQRAQDLEGMHRYLDTIVAISPESGAERWMRAVVRYQLRRPEDSRADVDWLLEHKPEGVDLNRVLELQQVLDRLE